MKQFLVLYVNPMRNLGGQRGLDYIAVIFDLVGWNAIYVRMAIYINGLMHMEYKVPLTNQESWSDREVGTVIRLKDVRSVSILIS